MPALDCGSAELFDSTASMKTRVSSAVPGLLHWYEQHRPHNGTMGEVVQSNVSESGNRNSLSHKTTGSWSENAKLTVTDMKTHSQRFQTQNDVLFYRQT